MVIQISENLKGAGLFLCKKESKLPESTDDWNNHLITWEEANKKLEEGYNIGLIGGVNDFFAIDCDSLELEMACEQILPLTYKERTCSGTAHFIYKVKEKFDNLKIEDLKKHYGEIRSNRQYIIIAPSKAVNKKGILTDYKVEQDEPIPYITQEEIKKVISFFMQPKEKVVIKEDAIKLMEKYNLNKTDAWLYDIVKNQIVIKESTGGNSIVLKNAAIILVRENIPAEEMRIISEAIITFIENRNLPMLYGWIKKAQKNELAQVNETEINNFIQRNNYPLTSYTDKQLQEQKEEEIRLIWDKELKDYQEPNTSWRIDKILKSQGIIVLGGKQATYKSWIAMVLASSIAQGKPLFGKFDTSPGKVLYLDRENQFSELKKRQAMIKKGMDITEDLDIGFISESYIKIDNPLDLNKLAAIVKENNISVIICDVYRRLISFEENDANEVSFLFVNYLKPFCEKLGVSIILLHHEKKGDKGNDEVDMLRGSSDLANYVDGIIQIERRGDTITLKQTKNRGAKEIAPFNLKIESDETTYFRFKYTGQPETIEVKVGKAITDWLLKYHLKTFSFTEGLNYCVSQGYNRNNYSTALTLLANNGLIEKEEGRRGKYKITNQLPLEGVW